MNIYQLDAGSRMGEFPSWSERLDTGQCIVIVHQQGRKTEDRLRKTLRGLLQYPECQGALVVGGTPYGGLSDAALARRLKMEFDGRAHFLSYAVDAHTMTPSTLLHRSKAFFSEVRQFNRIDWAILDPEFPENLCALYMYLRAVCTAECEVRQRLLIKSKLIEDCLRSAAEDEFLLCTRERLSTAQITASSAAELAEEIATGIAPTLLRGEGR